MKKFYLLLGIWLALGIKSHVHATLAAPFLISGEPLPTEYRAGDPNVKFNKSKFDSEYPQIREWVKAGVRGGIPFVDNLAIKEVINPGATSGTINAAINKVAKQGGGAILL